MNADKLRRTQIIAGMKKHLEERYRLGEMLDGLESYIDQHVRWSKVVFGPGHRTEGLLKHIAKELEEIRRAPTDLAEWVDVMILAIDGAWRAGFAPWEIARMLVEKQKENMARKWPTPKSEDEPVEHVRS